MIASGDHHEHWQAGHYASWLGYAWLQQGRFTTAREHLDRVRANLGRAARRGEQPSLLSMRAQYIINSERWTDPVVQWQLEAPGAAFVAQAMDAHATAYAAIKSGQRARAEQYLADLVRRGKSPAVADFYSANASVPAVLERQLRALLLLEDGKRADGLALLREAAAMEDAIPVEFGPPDIVKPTHELLGEVLLAFGDARSRSGVRRAGPARPDPPAARRRRTQAREALGDSLGGWGPRN